VVHGVGRVIGVLDRGPHHASGEVPDFYYWIFHWVADGKMFLVCGIGEWPVPKLLGQSH